MTRCLCLFHSIARLAYILLAFLIDGMRYLGLCLRSPAVLAAANLFLRKQLALYQERGVKPKRVTPATRLALVLRNNFILMTLDVMSLSSDNKHGR
jgi:hypothetical protein